MQEEGIVGAILYDAGTKDLPLGTVLAVLVEDEDDLGAFKDYKDDGASAGAAPASTPAPEAKTEAAPSTPTPAAATTAASQPAATGDRKFASPLA